MFCKLNQITFFKTWKHCRRSQEAFRQTGIVADEVRKLSGGPGSLPTKSGSFPVDRNRCRRSQEAFRWTGIAADIVRKLFTENILMPYPLEPIPFENIVK
jgi:hypothetical protein